MEEARKRCVAFIYSQTYQDEVKKTTNTLQLGIPTANIPVDNTPWIESCESGVYFGWAGVKLSAEEPASEESTRGLPESARQAGWQQFPMVMSIGYNPFYKNTVRSAVRSLYSLYSLVTPSFVKLL